MFVSNQGGRDEMSKVGNMLIVSANITLALSDYQELGLSPEFNPGQLKWLSLLVKDTNN